MSRIQHPNVVGYFESFVEDGSLHIVMEYADGEFHSDTSVLSPCIKETSKTSQAGVCSGSGRKLKKRMSISVRRCITTEICSWVIFSCLQQILYWTAQIVSALKYVHTQKIMHRDLKLANIMLTKQVLLESMSSIHTVAD